MCRKWVVTMTCGPSSTCWSNSWLVSCPGGKLKTKYEPLCIRKYRVLIYVCLRESVQTLNFLLLVLAGTSRKFKRDVWPLSHAQTPPLGVQYLPGSYLDLRLFHQARLSGCSFFVWCILDVLFVPVWRLWSLCNSSWGQCLKTPWRATTCWRMTRTTGRSVIQRTCSPSLLQQPLLSSSLASHQHTWGIYSHRKRCHYSHTAVYSIHCCVGRRWSFTFMCFLNIFHSLLDKYTAAVFFLRSQTSLRNGCSKFCWANELQADLPISSTAWPTLLCCQGSCRGRTRRMSCKGSASAMLTTAPPFPHQLPLVEMYGKKWTATETINMPRRWSGRFVQLS